MNKKDNLKKFEKIWIKTLAEEKVQKEFESMEQRITSQLIKSKNKIYKILTKEFKKLNHWKGF